MSLNAFLSVLWVIIFGYAFFGNKIVIHMIRVFISFMTLNCVNLYILRINILSLIFNLLSAFRF